MNRDDLRRSIIKKIIEIEKRNSYNNYPKTKEMMVKEIERIIVEEVDIYENTKNQA